MSQEDRIEWSGYKLATFLVSLFSVLVIGAQALYNNFYVQRWKEIEYLTAELDRKRQELQRQEAIPRVASNINTLEKAGLSIQLLSSLSAIPSTVEIKNVGGGTVRGLLVDIASTEQIIQFQKWQSPESFLVTRAGADGKGLRLQAAQIRKGSVIGLTLLTKKLPKLETKVLLDSGELVSEEKAEESKPPLLLNLRPDLYFRLSREEVARFRKEINPSKLEMLTLEKQIETLKSESIWDFISVSLAIAYLIPAAVVVYPIVLVLQWLRGDHLKRSRMNKTIQDITSNTFQPRTLTEVLRDLGTPDESKVSGEGDASEVELVYFSKYEMRPSRNGVRLRFRDQKLLRAEDERGYPILQIDKT